MGNACFCKNSNFIKDINLESSPLQPIVNTKSGQFIPKDEDDIEKKKNQKNWLIKENRLKNLIH